MRSLTALEVFEKTISAGRKNDLVRFIYDQVDQWFLNGDFAVADDYLDMMCNLPREWFGENKLRSLAVLSISKAAAGKLKNRGRYYDCLRAAIPDVGVQALLAGLR